MWRIKAHDVLRHTVVKNRREQQDHGNFINNGLRGRTGQMFPCLAVGSLTHLAGECINARAAEATAVRRTAAQEELRQSPVRVTSGSHIVEVQTTIPVSLLKSRVDILYHTHSNLDANGFQARLDRFGYGDQLGALPVGHERYGEHLTILLHNAVAIVVLVASLAEKLLGLRWIVRMPLQLIAPQNGGRERTSRDSALALHYPLDQSLPVDSQSYGCTHSGIFPGFSAMVDVHIFQSYRGRGDHRQVRCALHSGNAFRGKVMGNI